MNSLQFVLRLRQRMATLSISQKQLVVKSLQVEVSLFETTYIFPFLGGVPWLKKNLRPVLGEIPKFYGNLLSFFYPL